MVSQTDNSATALKGLTVQDAITEYVMQDTIPDEQKRTIHPELTRFARWIGANNELSSLRPSDISPYSETFGGSASEANKQRIASIKDFLNYVKKKGYVSISLAPHIRARKPSLNSPGRAMRRRNTEVQITQQGYDEMVNRLEQLRGETVRLADEIERAAASGDVRENSPLEAARENQGMVQAQINRLESTLKVATIIPESERVSDHVQIGSWVSLIKEGTEMTVDYQVVAANEANPLQHKISDISPLGSAIMDGRIGDNVVVKAPAGAQKFTITAIF